MRFVWIEHQSRIQNLDKRLRWSFLQKYLKPLTILQKMFDRVVSASLSIITKFSSNENKNTVATKIVNYSVNIHALHIIRNVYFLRVFVFVT